MQCSAVQCSAVQCSAVQCSAVQCSVSLTELLDPGDHSLAPAADELGGGAVAGGAGRVVDRLHALVQVGHLDSLRSFSIQQVQ